MARLLALIAHIAAAAAGATSAAAPAPAAATWQGQRRTRRWEESPDALRANNQHLVTAMAAVHDVKGCSCCSGTACRAKEAQERGLECLARQQQSTQSLTEGWGFCHRCCDDCGGPSAGRLLPTAAPLPLPPYPPPPPYCGPALPPASARGVKNARGPPLGCEGCHPLLPPPPPNCELPYWPPPPRPLGQSRLQCPGCPHLQGSGLFVDLSSMAIDAAPAPWCISCHSATTKTTCGTQMASSSKVSEHRLSNAQHPLEAVAAPAAAARCTAGGCVAALVLPHVLGAARVGAAQAFSGVSETRVCRL